MTPAREQGERVRQALMDAGIETPVTRSVNLSEYSSVPVLIEYHIKEIMQELGLDLDDDSLKGTPSRVGRMLAHELFSGLDYDNFPLCMTVANKMHSKDEFVLVDGITVSSTCEHHFVPIRGSAVVAYVPKDRVLGLSKINRIVDFFSKRPQVQERLTRQIAVAIKTVTDCADVAVLIAAEHMCVSTRGVRDPMSQTVTYHGEGRFGDISDPIRAEFMGRSRGR